MVQQVYLQPDYWQGAANVSLLLLMLQLARRLQLLVLTPSFALLRAPTRRRPSSRRSWRS